MGVGRTWVPAPLSGQNFIANPLDLKIDEARLIENYYVYDWGLRARGRQYDGQTFSGSGDTSMAIMVPFYIVSGGVLAEWLVLSTNKHLYLQTSVTGAEADITPGGGFSMTTGYTSATTFNGKIVLVNATDKGIVFDIGTATAAVATTTPDMSTFNYIWNYKNRLYGSAVNTTTYYYGAVGATAGTLTSVDIAQVLRQSGTIAWGASWSLNQGIQNEELFVIGTNSGEVLIYSGTYPGAGDWQLVNRIVIPKPVGVRPVFNFGQDVLISTNRGIVPLSQAVAGRGPAQDLFILSKNLGNGSTGARTHMALNVDAPFLYSVAGDANASLALVYVLNFERGAWSQFKFYLDTVGGETTVTSICFYTGLLVVGTNAAKTYYISLTDGEQPSVIFSWKTPYFDFGNANEKHITMVRAIARSVNPGTTPTIINTVSVSPNFKDPATAITSTKTTTVGATDTDYYIQELAPPGVGRYLSLVHEKIAAGEINDVAGMEVYIQEGGIY